jgi:thiol-disulfide isomerase/thioredoxin
MPKFTELIYTRFIQPYSQLLFVGFLLIIFSVCAYYSYILFFDKKPENQKYNDIANTNPDSGILTIMLFHVDWCPHCKKALPDWNDFKSEYNTREVNGYTVECIELDCTNEENPQTNSIREKYKVESFPTVIATMTDSEGKPVKIDFDAKVSKKNLTKFVESISTNSKVGL